MDELKDNRRKWTTTTVCVLGGMMQGITVREFDRIDMLRWKISADDYENELYHIRALITSCKIQLDEGDRERLLSRLSEILSK